MRLIALVLSLLLSSFAHAQYTLLSTGQAADLVALWMVDEDGLTLREWVTGYSSTWNGSNDWTDNDAEMTVEDAVVVGSGTWKGETLNYFETLADGSFDFHGILLNATGDGRPTIDIGSGDPGVGVWFASAGHAASSGTAWGYMLQLGAATQGLKRGTSTSGGLLWEIAAADITADAGTDLPTNGTTKFSAAANYEYNTSQGLAPDYGYGLESGSLAADGTYTPQTRGASDTTISAIGGAAGLGHFAGKYFALAIFNSPRSLAQMQALHDDFMGELFEPTGGGAPSSLLLRRRRG
jgi:hypothetical protein